MGPRFQQQIAKNTGARGDYHPPPVNATYHPGRAPTIITRRDFSGTLPPAFKVGGPGGDVRTHHILLKPTPPRAANGVDLVRRLFAEPVAQFRSALASSIGHASSDAVRTQSVRPFRAPIFPIRALSAVHWAGVFRPSIQTTSRRITQRSFSASSLTASTDSTGRSLHNVPRSPWTRASYDPVFHARQHGFE